MIQTVVKGLLHAAWSNPFGMAYIENNAKNLNLIFEDFKGTAWINCSNFFPTYKNKHNNSPVNAKDFKVKGTATPKRICPDSYLQITRIKTICCKHSKNLHSFI